MDDAEIIALIEQFKQLREQATALALQQSEIRQQLVKALEQEHAIRRELSEQGVEIDSGGAVELLPERLRRESA